VSLVIIVTQDQEQFIEHTSLLHQELLQLVLLVILVLM
jgi:hypothetical protein